ncbi:MAG: acyl-CoA dehydrogenase domain-containing protein, partial [Aestuariivirgaceae bacterium]
VHSGKAVIDGPKNYLSSAYRAVPIAITVEGANIMTRSLMIYGQGSIRCHPFIQDEIEAAQNEDRDQALQDFDKILFKHIGYTLKTMAKAIGRSWTFGLASSSPVNGPTARYYKQIKRLSAALALTSEAAMVTMGGALKRKEMISARLGDVISHLYLTSAVLKRFEDTGCPDADLPLVNYAAQSHLNKAETALNEVIVNFPMTIVGWKLRFALQPFGVRCRKPVDKLTARAANVICEPNATRDRLTEGIYVTDDIELGRLDKAFRMMVDLEPVKQKMRKARIRTADQAEAEGVITGNEAAAMREALALVREVSMVDDFTAEEITGKPAARKTNARKKKAA